MASRFLQGDGRPVLYRYNSSNVVQASVTMPYVRDDANNYIRQSFIPYPADEDRIHQLLDGERAEDQPTAFQLRIEIKYSSISAAELQSIYNQIILSKFTSGNYLSIKPRDDYDTNVIKVIYRGDLKLESQNAWEHNVTLEFLSVNKITSLELQIPPVSPS